MIKENFKNIFSILIFLFGIIEFIFLCMHLKNSKTWTKAYIFSQISIFLSSLITRQGIWLILTIAGFFGFSELEFGKKVLFEVNPWHSKHILSLAALFFSSLAICLKCIHPNSFSNVTLFVLVFNTIASRPVLHLGYKAVSFLF